jgi:outer membrane lipoprotein-sorting protein
MAKTRLTILLLTTSLALSPVSGSVRGASTPAEDDNGPVPQVSDPTLARILDQWDKKQQESVTLVASFSERKDLKLLAKPVISHGEFYYSRPNHVRWEYKEPDHKVYVITEDMYTAYFPALKRAEEVPIKKFLGKRMFRFLAVGQRIGDLARYYDFRLAPQSDVKGTHLLLLTPRSRTVRDHVAEMKIWVDETTGLPRQLQYFEPDGDTTLLAFEDMRTNVDVAADLFKITLPADVVVSQTFNGFALGQQSF